jgi:hypothetical protein
MIVKCAVLISSYYSLLSLLSSSKVSPLSLLCSLIRTSIDYTGPRGIGSIGENVSPLADLHFKQ